MNNNHVKLNSHLNFPTLNCKFKSVSIREIRQRGFQRKNSVKYGTKAEEPILFGDYISLPGEIYSITKTDIKPCNFLYYNQDFILAGDNIFRKGCRPNTSVEIKVIDEKIAFVARAIKDINVNDEILLPLDYENKREKLECVCNEVDYCLKLDV